MTLNKKYTKQSVTHVSDHYAYATAIQCAVAKLTLCRNTANRLHPVSVEAACRVC